MSLCRVRRRRVAIGSSSGCPSRVRRAGLRRAVLAEVERHRAEATAGIDTVVIAVNKAYANADSTPTERAEAEAAVAKAERDAEQAQREAADADAEAAAALRLAEAKLAEMQAPPDLAVETRRVSQSESNLETVTASLTDLEARSGPMVPLGEVVFIGSLPATVTTLGAASGPRSSRTRTSTGVPTPWPCWRRPTSRSSR